MKTMKHVVCGMSGGVDSAVAALLLQRKGYQVTGVFMKNWDLTNETGNCTIEQDEEDAKFVCSQLGIPFRTANFVKEYWNEVFSEMIAGYQKGWTPNPDVLCNRCIKFGHFFNHVTTKYEADAVATGHYARNSWGQFLEHPNQTTGCSLLTAVDQVKDQTLFLSQIPQRALQRTMFPVGDLKKTQVRKIAELAGMSHIVRKKESTGICFIGKRHFQDFIDEYLEPKPGNFVDIDTGQVVGTHKGLHYWTYGQRTHIPGKDKAYFVAQSLPDTNQILVAKGTEHPALLTCHVTTETPHWINQPPVELVTSGRIHCHFRYQHAYRPEPCMVTVPGHRLGSDSIEDFRPQTMCILLEKPHRAIAQGQYAVLYQGEECLGSARILSAEPTLYEEAREELCTGAEERS